MKILAALLSLTLTPLCSFAAAPTVFTCGSMGHGTAFAVQFGGPRYADSISIQYLGEDLKKFLPESEASLETSTESLRSSLSMGSCSRGTNGNTLVSCNLGQQWSMTDIGFTTFDKISKDFHQSNSISRNIHVLKLDLQVVKEGTHAKLQLGMVVDTAHKRNLVVNIERDLGTLEHDWYMCEFK